MMKLIINKFNSMEDKIKKILRYGIYFSVFVCVISVFILLTYHFHTSPDLFYIRTILYSRIYNLCNCN